MALRFPASTVTENLLNDIIWFGLQVKEAASYNNERLFYI
jgi:hypothetical protein